MWQNFAPNKGGKILPAVESLAGLTLIWDEEPRGSEFMP